MGELIYLDHAAATPLDAGVEAAMRPYYDELFFNPSSAYRGGREARDALEGAREKLASAIAAKAHDIVCTAGATESINLAIHGVCAGGGHVVIGATEHDAVFSAARMYPHAIASANTQGIITPEAVMAKVTDDTVLVSVTMADSELGTVQPIAGIARMLDGVRADRLARGIVTPLFFHSDGSQALGQLDVNTARLGVDLLTLNAGKCYGPKQVGLLWLKPTAQLVPLVAGGGQERGLRSGTENLAGVVGFAHAAQAAVSRRHSHVEKLQKMRDTLQTRLRTLLPEMIINGSIKKRLPGHLNISIDELDAERVLFRLDEANIYASTGSACAANKQTRSRTLTAIGLRDSQADGSLRFTFGRLNSIEQIEPLAQELVRIIREEQAL